MKFPDIHNPHSVLVVGVGNEFRSDDRAGLVIARMIDDLEMPGVNVVTASGEGGELMSLWKTAESVILIDAMVGEQEAGAIRRIEANAHPLSLDVFRSSHEFGVAHAIELARTLRELPSNIIVYGIQGKKYEMGEGLSHEVERAMAQAAAMIVNDIQSLQSAETTKL